MQSRVATTGLPWPCLTPVHPLTVPSALSLSGTGAIFPLSCLAAQGCALHTSEFRKADLCSAGQVQELLFCRSGVPHLPCGGSQLELAVCHGKGRSTLHF